MGNLPSAQHEREQLEQQLLGEMQVSHMGGLRRGFGMT